MSLRTSQKALLSAIAVVFVATFVWLAFVNHIVRSAMAESLPGSGVAASMESVTRSDLTGFSSIRAQNGWDLILTQGASWQVQISYPHGMGDRIDTVVRDDVLELNFRPPRGFRLLGVGSPGRGSATITMPSLARVQLEGAGTANLSGFEGDRLELSGAGAFSITAQDSRFTHLELSMSGAGEVDLRGLTAVSAHVSLTGATNTILSMGGGALTGAITGAGQLEYYGAVSAENVTRAGAAVVRHAQ
jgi:hypothetical protein